MSPWAPKIGFAESLLLAQTNCTDRREKIIWFQNVSEELIHPAAQQRQSQMRIEEREWGQKEKEKEGATAWKSKKSSCSFERERGKTSVFRVCGGSKVGMRRFPLPCRRSHPCVVLPTVYVVYPSTA